MQNQPLSERHFKETAFSKSILLITGTLILSIPAFYNGYPLVYSDTGTYLYSGFDLFVPNDRPLAYGLFLRLSSLKFSAWLSVLLQNLITAFILFETTTLVVKESILRVAYPLLVLGLTLVTGIGWYSNQLMPDFFAAILILCIFILARKSKLLGVSGIAVSLIFVLALSTHFTHILLALLFLVALLIVRKTRAMLPVGRIWVLASLIAAALLVNPVLNYIFERNFMLSRGSHVFLMAHLNDTGMLKEYLDEKCPDAPERLCNYKDSLPADLAAFMWDGKTLESLGGWVDSKEDFNQVIEDNLKGRYLFENLFYSVMYGLIQLTRFEIGQGIGPYEEGSAPYGQIHWRFRHELNQYLNSRQNKWKGADLNFVPLNRFHLIVISLSVLILLFLFKKENFRGLRTGSRLLLNIAIYGIVLNAFVTAGLNSPCERFQARVIWLLPFALTLLILSNWKHLHQQLKQ